ncbi:MAG: YqiA/YcfP family alpha/beta fold hydrolase [Gammaproteobacteria bacterium]
MKIIYLHGFNSSAESKKSKILDSYLKEEKLINLESPNLNSSPSRAISQVEKIIKESSSKVCVLGSSLGGLYATFIADKYNLKSVTINPVVRNHISGMKDIVGSHKNFHTNEEYEFTTKDYLDLQKLGLKELKKPLNHLCFIKMSDEVLDHNKTLAYFSKSYVLSEKGGNHSYDDFFEKIPLILDYMY